MPALVPDAEFDLGNHVHRITLAAPRDDRGVLLATICELHPVCSIGRVRCGTSTSIDGLADGRVALYAKMHHGIVDGVGFMKILSQWLAASPKDRVVRAMWEGVEDSAPPLRRREQGCARPGRLVRTVAGAREDSGCRSRDYSGSRACPRSAPARAATFPFVATPGVLESDSVGAPLARASRIFAREVKALGKTRDATINDMLLTMLAVALIRYLEHKGVALAKPLVADMPVALDAGSGGAIESRWCRFRWAHRVSIPPSGSTPSRRRRGALKGQLHGRCRPTPRCCTRSSPMACRACSRRLRLHDAPLLANLVVSNPFGFAEARYLMGAEVELSMPISVVAPGTGSEHHGRELRRTAIRSRFSPSPRPCPISSFWGELHRRCVRDPRGTLRGETRKRRSRGGATAPRRRTTKKQPHAIRLPRRGPVS